MTLVLNGVKSESLKKPACSTEVNKEDEEDDNATSTLQDQEARCTTPYHLPVPANGGDPSEGEKKRDWRLESSAVATKRRE
jgi:hypothetical protein